MKKLVALVLCLCMALSVFAVCGSAAEEAGEPEEAVLTEEELAEEPAEAAEEEPAEEEPAEEEPAEEEAAEEAESEPAEEAEAAEEEMKIIGMNGGTGAETYDPYTVVGTVNGEEVTWMEYYYWMQYYIQYTLRYVLQYGIIPAEWDGTELPQMLGGEEGDTNADFIVKMAQDYIAQEHAYKAEFEKMGVMLTEDDMARIQENYEQAADQYGGDGDGTATEEEFAAFEEFLKEQGLDFDFFYGMNDVYFLLSNAFESEYGKNAENYSDEDTLAFAADMGYDLAAKHILFLTVDPSTGEVLPDEQLEEKLAQAEDVLAQLKEAENDPEALEALFDELTAEYTEDTGYAAFPDGYVFTDGQMVAEFEEAVKSLEDYGLSDIVETSYGYHIILRIPVTPDATPVDLENPLRYEAAATQFDGRLRAWLDSAEVEWYEGFESPDMEAIFG